MLTKGLVIDGHDNVGEFEDISEPDKFGMRTIKNLYIESEYIDIAKQQTNKPLEFLVLIEVESDNAVLTKKIDEGIVYGSFWASDSGVIFDSAKFLPIPSKSDLKNAN